MHGYKFDLNIYVYMITISYCDYQYVVTNVYCVTARVHVCGNSSISANILFFSDQKL